MREAFACPRPDWGQQAVAPSRQGDRRIKRATRVDFRETRSACRPLRTVVPRQNCGRSFPRWRAIARRCLASSPGPNQQAFLRPVARTVPPRRYILALSRASAYWAPLKATSARQHISTKLRTALPGPFDAGWSRPLPLGGGARGRLAQRRAPEAVVLASTMPARRRRKKHRGVAEPHSQIGSAEARPMGLARATLTPPGRWRPYRSRAVK